MSWQQWGNLNKNQTMQVKQSLSGIAWNVATKVANNTGIAQKIAELSGAPSKDTANAFFLPNPKNYYQSLYVTLTENEKKIMTEKEMLDSVRKAYKDYEKNGSWQDADNPQLMSRRYDKYQNAKKKYELRERLLKKAKEDLWEIKAKQAREQAMKGLLAENFLDFNPVFENADYTGSYNTNTFVRAFLTTQETIKVDYGERVVGYQVAINFWNKGIKYKRGKIFSNDQAYAIWDDDELSKLTDAGKLAEIRKKQQEGVEVPIAVLCIPCLDGYPIIEKEVVQNESPVATSLASVATHRQVKPRRWTFAFPVAYLSVYGENAYGERAINFRRRMNGIATNRSTGNTKKGAMNKYKQFKQTATNYMNSFWNSVGMRNDADGGNVITQQYRSIDSVETIMEHLDNFTTQKGCILNLGFTPPVPVTCSMEIGMGRGEMDCVYVTLRLTESVTFDSTRMKSTRAISSTSKSNTTPIAKEQVTLKK